MKGKRIICPNCKVESALKISKKFEGFTVIGELRTCALCGYEFPDDDITTVKEEKITIFDDVGKGKVCRSCSNFVVNPWVQKCVIKDEEVDALDSCERFEKKTQKK